MQRCVSCCTRIQYEGEDRIEKLVYSLTPQSKIDPFSDRISSGSIKVSETDFVIDY